MKAIYPYIHSRYDEIRYSLRSLEKHTDLDSIIIGDKPDWYTGEHISFPSLNHKITNVYFKIRRACLEKSVSDRFLLMNDDIYLLEGLKPVHYVNGRVEELWSEYEQKSGSSYYTQCLRNTVTYVGTSWNYETHTPMWMDKEGFLSMNADLFIDDPPLFRTMYGSQSELPVIDIQDGDTLRQGEVKYYRHIEGDELDEFISGKPCFSTPDTIRIQGDLARLFPVPSRWEI